MARLSALDKLNRMHAAFTTDDDAKLGRGEVDALAAFYGGLGARDKASVKSRLMEIYRDSSYAGAQKSWFLQSLERVGLAASELEGVPADSADGFARMSKPAQFDRLQSLDGGDGFVKDTTERSITGGALAKVRRGIDKFESDYVKRHGGGEDAVEFGDRSVRAIYLSEGSNQRGKDLVGWAIKLGIYADEHDVDQTLYFNRKGEMLGNVYSGE